MPVTKEKEIMHLRCAMAKCIRHKVTNRRNILCTVPELAKYGVDIDYGHANRLGCIAALLTNFLQIICRRHEGAWRQNDLIDTGLPDRLSKRWRTDSRNDRSLQRLC